ncbi:epoxyqueuosine reductase [Cohaesibacter sp. ES.047]|uniref:tRNA epoxyqueuosine(34) reductase QueG n=1 Tax=Cohaesibacter sp. ES.047 TaxID=1798205 RepID=UPI000BB972AE|nr:tRNA epoxyqueuosine(34) reductase QueG [Cohaesibacter sp. ES.047]SNY90092.1 epoxyqueuosine reductase [Cohaesibacter sp. ES.047]
MTETSGPAEKQAKLRTFLEKEAKALGFSDLRICRTDNVRDHEDTLLSFTANGYHGSMEWIKETLARRSHPNKLWDGARSVIMLGFNYGPEGDPLATLHKTDCASISVYARHRDYHDVLKGRLKQLAAKLLARVRESQPDGEIKVFVDTAPVMEKMLAATAGLGWQGKHTNLVSRDIGSWFFLGAIFTSLDLAPDAPEVDHCGSCRACLDACPTKAFPEPYKIDARRCISYLTIENKGPIPHEFRSAMGNRIYGCDDCLAACPWNKFAQVASEAKLKARTDLNEPSLHDLLALDDTEFRKLFSGSPIKRIGRNRFLRNVLIATGNSNNPALGPIVRRHVSDPEPIVRGAAIWALGRLISKEAFESLASPLVPCETDPYVQEEWHRAMAEETT